MIHPIVSALLNAARGIGRAIGMLFSPVTRPLSKLLSLLGFHRRSAVWRTPAMRRTQDQLIRSMFKPLADTAPNQIVGGPQFILRPVSVLFVAASLLGAFLFNLLPWGALSWVPDFLAITLMFWTVREPRIVSIGTAFAVGLLMDVHDATVLGEHALSYTLLAYAAAVLSRRLPAFTLGMQALQVLPVFYLSTLATLGVRVFFGGFFPGWQATLIAPALSALLWPAATWVLLAPQRRPIDVDNTRPL
jgi:rod shape-determining protein MreD